MAKMSPNRRVLAMPVMLALLATMLGGCLTSVGGPNEDRPEQFEFVPLPATRTEATEAFRDLFANDPMTLVENSVTPIGKIVTGQGPVVFAEFEMIDPEQGLQVCSGSAGPFSGGWGCRGADVPAPDDPDPREPLQAPAVGSTGTWSEVEFAVNGDVDHLTAVAADGTTYRLEPLAGIAWMEWRTEHGDLVVTAYDAEGNSLAEMDVAAP